MTPSKVQEVITRYKNRLADAYRYGTLDKESIHCYSMLQRMERFIQQKRMEKTFRWLGFVQGVLWIKGFYTIEEFKNHNKPHQGDK